MQFIASALCLTGVAILAFLCGISVEMGYSTSAAVSGLFAVACLGGAIHLETSAQRKGSTHV